jgi:glycosyltransferase involved in cell wall biosynthesis
LHEKYLSYDAFAFPTSEREPFAFAPLEAAARGCVPIISAVCGNAEWFIDGVDCLKVERHASAVADRIGKVLDGSLDLESMGRRAARVIRRDFHLDNVLPQIVNVLDAAIRENRDPRNSTEEAYRLAVLAERTFFCLSQELAA